MRYIPRSPWLESTLLSAVNPLDEAPHDELAFQHGESEQDGMKIIRGPDGITILDPNARGPRIPQDNEFDGNLAKTMQDAERKTLAMRLCEYLEIDKASRKDWEERGKRGLALMGVVDIPKEDKTLTAAVAAPGVAQVKMPMLSEAVTRFQARSMAELFPAAGPVKGSIVGPRTSERVAQADRIETFSNYYLTIKDEGYIPDSDQMLMYLPIDGSVFRKAAQNWVTGMPELRMVSASRLVVPYSASTLREASRYAHEYTMSGQDIRRAIDSGMFADVRLTKPADGEATNTAVADKSDGRVQMSHEDDADYPVAEYHIDLELDIDEMGKSTPTEIGADGQQELLPYVVIVEKTNFEVLLIRRNWKQDDPQRQKRLWFAHHKFFPGLGFYGWGYAHLIGSLQKALNDGVNSLLDAGFFANFQGGFITKEGKTVGLNGEIELKPGVYKQLEGTFDEISKAIFHPDFKQPSPALAQLVIQLMEAGQRFSSTTEAATGNADNTGPVGTTLALIEQSNIVPTSIHKRLHGSLALEFRMWGELVYEYMPNEYEYEIQKEKKQLLRSDFDGRVDIVPVSDPNIWSLKQRILLAQGVLELQAQAPDLYGKAQRIEAHRRMLEAMRVPDIDAVGPQAGDEPKYLDPIAENMSIMMGVPVKAFETQDHQAHAMIHEHGRATFMASPVFAQMDPQKQQTIMALFDAHQAEHMALGYRRMIMSAVGIQLPPLGPDGQEQALPPQVEAQITAAIVQRLPPPPPPTHKPGEGDQVQAGIDAEDKKAQADIARKNEAFSTDEARKKKAFDAEQKRMDDAHKAELGRLDTEVATRLIREKAISDGKLKAAEASAAQTIKHAAVDKAVDLSHAQTAHEQDLEHAETAHEQELDQTSEAHEAQMAAAEAKGSSSE